jgi:hypothetical protein
MGTPFRGQKEAPDGMQNKAADAMRFSGNPVTETHETTYSEKIYMR